MWFLAGTSHSEEIINNASAMLEIVILPANRDTNVLKVGISRPLSTPPEDLSNIASGVANSVTAASEQKHPTSLCQVKTDINLIALRKEKLRLQNLCNVCRDEKANRLFLPCSHVSACASCLPSLTHCPRCLFLIRGIVSVYFS